MNLTDHVACLYRTQHVTRLWRENKMPIEIKGLSQNVTAARNAMAQARAAITDMQTSVSGLIAVAADIKSQCDKAKSDLMFDAQSLGNSPPESPSQPSPSGNGAAEPTSTAAPAAASTPQVSL